MNTEIAGRLRAEYEYLWHDSMTALPDGWIEPLVKMLDRLYVLSLVAPQSFLTPSLATWVRLRVEVQPSSAMAFMTPMMPTSRWHGNRALECIEALVQFHGGTQETCSICGADGFLRMPILGDRGEGVFCDEHAGGVE
ncbi:hypothetical protein AB4Z52_13665 [Rhizobium sp. 2YAF20]|uniref:hypothetical protein n=1 Tax=Rhizobium sp. 2YAF20 TaxID=3233027 RepID=UPI003F96FB9C